MVAVITAGGRGTRIASVDGSVPKPMLPVAGKPVLKRQVEGLRRQGIDRIIFTIGYKGGQIRDFFGDGSLFGVQIDYIEEKEPLGTAGALYYLKDRVKEDFLLINGDLIFDVDLHRMMDFHKERHAAATLLVHPNDHPYDSGLIAAGETGQVNGWLSKEDKRGWYQNCANAGIHILSPRLLDKLDAPQKTDLDRDLLKPRIRSGEVYAYRSPEYVKDMGTPERIAQVEKDLRSGLVARKNLCRKQRAVFLDRDGTINKYVGFLRNIDDFELIDGVAERIRKINQSGYLAIVVTNQPVIARGEVTWAQLREIHDKMETLLGEKGAYVEDIFVCPHHPDRGFPGEVAEYKVDCDCRKPKPGMLLRAAERYNIDLSESWMVGDSERDMEAGRRAGCHVKRVINVR
ncbi:HAD-IIIA family hydrolase [Acutalibacter muris]|jgi:D-glycero-D-manno-heptose 1,7-bisphosphate phosphatase|uniref:HAD-IIIA family hydrolase n=1 Tax=Acutalibacter muris TaxID=1796620 RepID=UPI0026F403DF|nr:HAD-IIIA family hydrolase [Acutalibacter muris]